MVRSNGPQANVRRKLAMSVDADAGALYDFAPFNSFAPNKLCKIVWPHGQRIATDLAQGANDVRQEKDPIYFVGERFNDGWRRTGRGKQTLPTGCLKARQAFADRRQIRRRRDTICRGYAKRAHFSALASGQIVVMLSMARSI